MFHYGKENWKRAALPDLGTSESVQRVVLHSLAELSSLSEKVDNWMRVLGYADKDLFAVRLALGEATFNAFRHGSQGDPSKVVRIGYLVTPAEVLLEVEDEGPGFDPNQVPEPLPGETIERMRGWGLYLMRIYMNGVRFNRQGNRVTLCRRRSNS